MGFPIPVTKAHTVYCRVRSSIAATIICFRFRIKRPDGEILRLERNITSTTAYANAGATIRLFEGELISVVAYPWGVSPMRGQTFVSAHLYDGVGDQRAAEQTLLQGYVTLGIYPSWPNSQIYDPQDGMGYHYAIHPGDPAPGANLAYVVGANRIQKVLTAGVRLVTSVAVANRLLSLVITKTGMVVAYRGAQAVQAGGLTVDYRFYFGGSFRQVAVETEEQAPPEIILYPTETLGFVVDNIDVADQLSLCYLLVEEWVGY